MIIVAAIVGAGLLVGSAYRRAYLRSDAPPDFVLYEFGAAVALACGHGFVDPGYAPSPAFAEFLRQKRDRITCAALPADVEFQPPNLTQRLYRYLMTATALVWVVSGTMSWTGLTPLYAALYATTLGFAYGLFRLGVGRVLAALATLALAISAAHLSVLPNLRDYAKAPFFLALLFIMARVALGRSSTKQALAWSVAFGIVLGIGFGFRNDLLVIVIPWMLVVLCRVRGRGLSAWRVKGLCLAASAAAFLVAAWPIVRGYSQGSNSGHVVLLGLMTTFDSNLAIRPSPYQWGYVYLDNYASTLVNSFTIRQYGHPVAYLSKEYDAATASYVLRIARHWPADMLVRGYASVLGVIDMPFHVGEHTPVVPYGVRDPRLINAYGQLIALNAFSGLGVLSVGLSLAIVSATSMRAALMLLLLLVYVAGYPVLQFQPRHFFHLEFVVWGALAFVIARAASGVRSVARLTLRRPAWAAIPRFVEESMPRVRASAIRLALFTGVALLVVVGPVWALRSYQSVHVRTLFEREYLGAPREAVATVATPLANGNVLIETPTLWSSRDSRVDTAYLVLELSPDRCEALAFRGLFRYDAQSDASNFSHLVDVPVVSDSQPSIVLSSVFRTPFSRFRGIEVAPVDAPCIARLWRIEARHVPPVLVEAQLLPHWRDAALYQTLDHWERPSTGDPVPTLYTNPVDLAVRRHPRVLPSSVLAPRWTARIVTRRADGTFLVKGIPDAPYSQVILLAEQTLTAGTIVSARGDIRTGGVTVGLLKKGEWSISTNVGHTGPFVAAVAVPETAAYIVTVCNYLPSAWMRAQLPAGFTGWFFRRPPFVRSNDVVITSFGWTPPAEPSQMDANR